MRKPMITVCKLKVIIQDKQQLLLIASLLDYYTNLKQDIISNFRTMNKAIILILGVFFMISCSDKKENPIGKWDDNIKLSTKHVVFSSETDSVTITTEGEWWWIDGISFEDSTYSYYNRDDINLESDSYSIEEEQFVVERRDKTILFVKIKENNTGIERKMNISLQAGNYFDHVTIMQSAY
ncbi:MAG: hypothetical protein K8F24_05490 [Bacteroidales bacterium]|nr:hypothetical protein [Bacteroidales bacterium]